MGLDTSHDAWHGPYTAFMRWRRWVAKQIGIPLDLMEGFYSWEWDGSEDLMSHFQTLYANPIAFDTLDAMKQFRNAIPWSAIKETPLRDLLHHSDCDGELAWEVCKNIADALQEIVDTVEDDFEMPVYSKDHPNSGEPIWTNWESDRARACYDGMVPATKRFIKGLRKAFKNQENLEFR